MIAPIPDPRQYPLQVNKRPGTEPLERALARILKCPVDELSIVAVVAPASEPMRLLESIVREKACVGCGCDVWLAPSTQREPRRLVCVCSDCLIRELEAGP